MLSQHLKNDDLAQPVHDISVIICTYTENRWNDLVAAIHSAQQQTSPPREIIVVIDHNPDLLKRVVRDVPGVIVIENQEAKGLSGARNSGAAIAQYPVVAFLDDDAIATPNWIEQLSKCYINSTVIGVGGKIEPLWNGKQPFWFPSEFNWTVGCTYHGMPTEDMPVRNVIGANMSVRRQVLLAVSGFRESFGCSYSNDGKSTAYPRPRWLRHHGGDEETEFCIRVAQQWPGEVWFYTPSALVRHHVSSQRTRWAYFLWRCYDEGLGKALLVKLHGWQVALSSERAYSFKTLPRAVRRSLTDALFHHDLTGLARAGAIVVGLAATTVGYLTGSVFLRITKSKDSYAKKDDLCYSTEIPLPGEVQHEI